MLFTDSYTNSHSTLASCLLKYCIFMMWSICYMGTLTVGFVDHILLFGHCSAVNCTQCISDGKLRIERNHNCSEQNMISLLS